MRNRIGIFVRQQMKRNYLGAMQVELPNLPSPIDAEDQLARHIRRIYAHYGGKLSPFFKQQARVRKLTASSHADPRMREYYERHYRMSAKVKSGEA